MNIITNAPWLEEIEARLPFGFPPVARQFLQSHEFIGLSTNCLLHYHNTGSDDLWALPIAIFRDKFIYELAITHRFIPIGQPGEVHYDRICLDLNRVKDGDCPLVQLDHEALLQFGRIQIIQDVYSSYQSFIDEIQAKPGYAPKPLHASRSAAG
jgi:hypothetical protein